MKLLQSFAAVAALASVTDAHYIWTKLITPSNTAGATEFIRYVGSNTPVSQVGSTDLRCNLGTQQWAKNTSVASIPAGSQVGFLNTGITHIGPIMIYMSKAPGSVQEYDGSGDWFKISQQGPTFVGKSASWSGTQVSKYSFTLPKALPDGEYLLRAEHIGIHSAKAPQFYVSCAHVKITGGGSGTPGPSIKFPGGYKTTDPSIFLDPYNPPIDSSYKVPGPAVWTG